MTLNVGHITYANCAPFFHYLSSAGFSGRIVPGVPAQLNRMLAEGTIDLSPSSSFEYGRNWRDYLLLPGHSISSAGPVKSVLLFSAAPLERLDEGEIALTGESATSIHLLQIILREYCTLPSLRCRVPQAPVEGVIADGGTALLIGDRALRAAQTPPAGVKVYDLGELWYRFTGLPFVFALWIVRREAAAAKREEIRSLLSQLGLSRRRSFDSLSVLATETPEREWMGEEALVDYWQAMSYELTDQHLQGLDLFFRLSVKYGFLPEMPEIRFFE